MSAKSGDPDRVVHAGIPVFDSRAKCHMWAKKTTNGTLAIV